MKPINKAVQTRQRNAILRKLFPEGIDKVKVWRNFVGLLGGEKHNSVSIERLEAVMENKYKLRQRLRRRFSNRTALMEVIDCADMDLLCSLTQTVWSFAGSHRRHAQNVIFLHGATEDGIITVDEAVLDWAAQSVITMLLRHIGATIPVR